MSYRLFTLVFIVFWTSASAHLGYGQHDAEQNPFGNADPFAVGTHDDSGVSGAPNNQASLPTEVEGERLKTAINKLKTQEKHFHQLIDRAVKDAQRSAGVSKESVKMQLQSMIKQLADRLFAVEQSLTNASIQLKRHALTVELAEMEKREREKEAINHQRIEKWLSARTRQPTQQTPKQNEQPFGNDVDPFSGDF